MEHVIKPVVPAKYLDDNTIFHLNPSGRFVIGGPHGDAGLTGRKIIIDTYGGWGAHGGGAFSGKDPTKVDRSGMCSWSGCCLWLKQMIWGTYVAKEGPMLSAECLFHNMHACSTHVLEDRFS